MGKTRKKANAARDTLERVEEDTQVKVVKTSTPFNK